MKNTKKSYFENLDTKKITDNRSFWRTVLPLFTQNSSKGDKIIFIDDSKTISSDRELYETFNHFSFPMVSDNLDPIMSVIKSFDKHLSIAKMTAKAFNSAINFRKTNYDEVEKIISNLNIKTSCQQ